MRVSRSRSDDRTSVRLAAGPLGSLSNWLPSGFDAIDVALEEIGLDLAALAWPVAITAGIVILLAKLGLLKPLIGVFVDGFKQIVKIAGPPFKDLINQFGRLWDAFGKGKGAFAIIKPILEFFISEVLSRGIREWLPSSATPWRACSRFSRVP